MEVDDSAFHLALQIAFDEEYRRLVKSSDFSDDIHHAGFHHLCHYHSSAGMLLNEARRPEDINGTKNKGKDVFNFRKYSWMGSMNGSSAENTRQSLVNHQVVANSDDLKTHVNQENLVDEDSVKSVTESFRTKSVFKELGSECMSTKQKIGDISSSSAFPVGESVSHVVSTSQASTSVSDTSGSFVDAVHVSDAPEKLVQSCLQSESADDGLCRNCSIERRPVSDQMMNEERSRMEDGQVRRSSRAVKPSVDRYPVYPWNQPGQLKHGKHRTKNKLKKTSAMLPSSEGKLDGILKATKEKELLQTTKSAKGPQFKNMKLISETGKQSKKLKNTREKSDVYRNTRRSKFRKGCMNSQTTRSVVSKKKGKNTNKGSHSRTSQASKLTAVTRKMSHRSVAMPDVTQNKTRIASRTKNGKRTKVVDVTNRTAECTSKDMTVRRSSRAAKPTVDRCPIYPWNQPGYFNYRKHHPKNKVQKNSVKIPSSVNQLEPFKKLKPSKKGADATQTKILRKTCTAEASPFKTVKVFALPAGCPGEQPSLKQRNTCKKFDAINAVRQATSSKQCKTSHMTTIVEAKKKSHSAINESPSVKASKSVVRTKSICDASKPKNSQNIKRVTSRARKYDQLRQCNDLNRQSGEESETDILRVGFFLKQTAAKSTPDGGRLRAREVKASHTGNIWKQIVCEGI